MWTKANSYLKRRNSSGNKQTLFTWLIWSFLFDGWFSHSSAWDDFGLAWCLPLSYYDVFLFNFFFCNHWMLIVNLLICAVFGFIPRTVKLECCMISFVYFIACVFLLFLFFTWVMCACERDNSSRSKLQRPTHTHSSSKKKRTN